MWKFLDSGIHFELEYIFGFNYNVYTKDVEFGKSTQIKKRKSPKTQ